jgi:hypothetical protein
LGRFGFHWIPSFRQLNLRCIQRYHRCQIVGHESWCDIEYLLYMARVQLQGPCWLEQWCKFGLGQSLGRSYSTSNFIPDLYSEGYWSFSWCSPCLAYWYETYPTRIQCFYDQLWAAKNWRPNLCWFLEW